MKDTRVRDLAVQHLEYVFSPPGLPLIEKAPGVAATTSVLVRGSAGAGKTTLAVSVAHAIARAGDGLVLYLTTEFAPAELAYKAMLLGLPEGSVHAWEPEMDLAVGSIAVQHLIAISGESGLSSIERKRGAVEALWRMVQERRGRAGAPVRAVVIDAFTLPGPGEDDAALRDDLVTFVQALEQDGISTVIIEEVGVGATGWLPFVVDLVFELGFATDPDTGTLHRKLTCPKSRYAITIPGPHDYGLEEGRPAVWPDLLAVLATGAKLPFAVPAGRKAAVKLVDGRGRSGLVRGGHLVVERYEERVGWDEAVEEQSSAVVVTFGPWTRISVKERESRIMSADGPHALAWAIVEAARRTGANAVIGFQINAVMELQRFRVPMLHALEAFRSLRFLACVTGEEKGMLTVEPMADASCNVFWGSHLEVTEPAPPAKS